MTLAYYGVDSLPGPHACAAQICFPRLVAKCLNIRTRYNPRHAAEHRRLYVGPSSIIVFHVLISKSQAE